MTTQAWELPSTPVDGATGDELIKSADTAMYRAKKQECSGVFFDRVEQEPASA